MPSARQLPLWIMLSLLSACGRVQETINPSDANRFNQVWKSMRAEGAKSTHPSEAPGADTIQFFEALGRLHDRLDAGSLGTLAAQEVPEDPGARDLWLKALQPLFADMEALLDLEPVKLAIQEGRSLAQRPSLHLELEPPIRYATPPVEASMRLVRPLAALAVHCANLPKGSDDCVRYLAQALDLIQLLYDGSLPGLRRSAVLGSEVLQSLRTLLPDSNVSPDFLRSQIEPRLALAASPGKLELTLYEEAIYRMAIGSSVNLTPKSAANVFGLKYLGCKKSEAVQHCLAFLAIQRSVRLQDNICTLVAVEQARGVLPQDVRAIDEYHDFEIASYLARVAMAINEHKYEQGSWPGLLNLLQGYSGGTPEFPCRARRSDYKQDFRQVSLSCFDRFSNDGKPDIPLHSWVWSREDPGRLNARR